jgi:hypothetical protein
VIESDLRRNHPLKGHMDKWIGNGKPWLRVDEKRLDRDVNRYNEYLDSMNEAFAKEMAIWMRRTKEQQEKLMDEKLGVIPKEPQWRPADSVDWPKTSKVNEPNTLDNPSLKRATGRDT